MNVGVPPGGSDRHELYVSFVGALRREERAVLQVDGEVEQEGRGERTVDRVG